MTDRLLGFAGVCVLLTFVPGVDTAMVTRSALARGARAGVQTALGAASGLFVHAAAVALGISALLARSAAGFEVLRLCGARLAAERAWPWDAAPLQLHGDVAGSSSSIWPGARSRMSTPNAGRLRSAWPAHAAAGLAFSSAAVSLYWTLGGTLLLDTVGGAFEDLARQRSWTAIALGVLVVVVKAVGGLLALALVQPWGSRIGRRWLLLAGFGGSAVLVLYGGALILVGGLVLGGVVDPSGPVDEHALRWHVFVWDLWFLVWGVLLGLATWRYRRRRAG